MPSPSREHAGANRDHRQVVVEHVESAVVVGLVPDSRAINTTEGVQGGGTLAADKTLKLDINGLTADATPDGAADYVATYDASGAVHKKVLLNDLPAGGGGAPVGAQYVTMALDGTLTSERTLAAEASVLTLTDGGANGAATLGVAAGGIGTAKLADGAATYAKIQDVSVTDRILGRQTAGAGDVEEIPCTAAGRALIDDASAADQRTTLGLGALATKSTVATADVDNDAVTYAKLQDVSATDKLLGRVTAGAGDVEEVACTAAGRALLDDADAGAQRTTLGLGTVATESTVPIAKGGTGQVTQQAAIDALTAVAGATNEHVLTKDTATGNAVFKANSGGGAPVGAQYVTVALDGTLSAERRLQAEASVLSLTDGGANGDITVGVAAQGIGTAKIADSAVTNLKLGTEAKKTCVQVVIGDGVNDITTGLKGFLQIPFHCTITAWHLVADASGSIVIDVWKDTYAAFPPTVADTIAGTEKPTLSSVQKNQDTALSSWTTDVNAEDWLAFNVDSATTVKQVTLVLSVTRHDG